MKIQFLLHLKRQKERYKNTQSFVCHKSTIMLLEVFMVTSEECAIEGQNLLHEERKCFFRVTAREQRNSGI